MTNFVLMYTGSTMPESEADSAQMMADWGAWYGKMGEAIVDGGNPFSRSKTVSADGISDGPAATPEVTGYTVIAADSIEEAAAMCEGHPHIKWGGKVTVHETFSM